MPSDQSKIFKYNIIMWKILGIWGGRNPSKYYKFYSLFYLFATFWSYNVLLTLNLIYTPRKIELILQEVIFYFTEITIGAKLLTILLMRDKIIEVFDMIDSDEFLGDYESTGGILRKAHTNYKFFWKLYACVSHVSFASHIFISIFLNQIRKTKLELPICQYYFLSDEDRQSFFIFWFLYQYFGMYGHMMYNVNIDSFIAGLLVIEISQLKLLNNNLRKFKLSEAERKLSKELQDKISITRINSCLRHYDYILKFHKIIQDILSTAIFFQFSVASVIVCVVMCGLMLSSADARVFFVIYLCTMTSQIFVPGYLGTQLTYESQELMFAAYNSEWIPRSESFKRSLSLFMERTKVPIMVTGLKMFPLSILTFTSIMKTAYSFFTLIINVQE